MPAMISPIAPGARVVIRDAEWLVRRVDRMTEDFLPGGPRERTIIYEAPYDRCDGEQDYAAVWKEFETRNGTKE